MAFNTMIEKPKAHRNINKIGVLVSYLLVPGFIVRLDHYLLLHYPLIWRTKVHYFAWFSLILANALLFGLGAFVSLETSNIPTLQQVDNWVEAIRLIGLMLLLGWGFTQFRCPMTESPIRLYLMTGLIYYVCIFSVMMLNPLAFVTPVVYRIAKLVPDTEFQQEYTFHEQNHFWCCHPEVNKESAELNRQRIIDSLGRYGFQKSFEFFETNEIFLVPDAPYCRTSSRNSDNDFLPCLAFQTYSGAYNPLLFRDRLVSLREAKRLKQSEGYYYENHIRIWSIFSMVSMELAGLLLLTVYPASARRRQFECERGQTLLTKLHLPQPGFLSHLDRFLRTRHPLVWSTRIHTFLYNSMVYGGLVILLIIALLSIIFPEMDFMDFMDLLEFHGSLIFNEFGLTFMGATLSIAWLYQQKKIPLKVLSTSDNLKALSIYIFITLFFQVLILGSLSIFGLLINFKDHLILLYTLGLFYSLFAAVMAFLQKFISGWKDILLPIIFYELLFIYFIVISNDTLDAPVEVMVGIWATIVLLLWFNNIKFASKLIGMMAVLYVLTTTFLSLFIPSLIQMSFELGNEPSFLWGILFGIPFFLLTLVPIIPILVHYSCQPKD